MTGLSFYPSDLQLLVTYVKVHILCKFLFRVIRIAAMVTPAAKACRLLRRQAVARSREFEAVGVSRTMSPSPLSTRDAVGIDVPARRATSFRLPVFGRRRGRFLAVMRYSSRRGRSS